MSFEFLKQTIKDFEEWAKGEGYRPPIAPRHPRFPWKSAGDVEFWCTRFEPWLFGLHRAEVEARRHSDHSTLLQSHLVIAHPNWNVSYIVTTALGKVVQSYMATARGLTCCASPWFADVVCPDFYPNLFPTGHDACAYLYGHCIYCGHAEHCHFHYFWNQQEKWKQPRKL